MTGRTWFLKNDYHSKEELTINGEFENDDLTLELQCHDHDYSVIVNLDNVVAIEVASELFRRVGLEDVLLQGVIREAVRMMKASEEEGT